jgi:hypothetical protein
MTWMEIVVLLLFLLVSCFVIFEPRRKQTINLLYACTIAFLFLFTVFRDPYKSRDYMTYVRIFNTLDFDTDIPGIEYSFTMVAKLIKTVTNNTIWLFAFYAIISILVKSYVMYELSVYPFVSLLAYIAYEFPNQELTAMRMGVAVGFLLLSLRPLYHKKYIIFFVYGMVAAYFHYSAISFILLPMFKSINTRNKQLLVFLLSLLIPFFIAPVLQGLFYIPHNSYLTAKIDLYANMESGLLNTFRFASIYRYIIFLVLLYFSNKIKEKNKYIFIEMAMFLCGIFLNSVFFFNTILCYRLSALFYSAEILLFPNIMYIFKSKAVAKFVLISILGLELLYLLYGIHFFKT